jgi:RNA polymerase sigma-70 factor (ECF subfamily)
MIQPIATVREDIVKLLPRLRRFARTLTRSAHDADDIVQIAVERALLRLDQWRPDANLHSWLFGIVRNAWIDETRARGRRARLLAPEEHGAHVAAPAGADVELWSVQAAMERLPEEQREAIGLVLVEGLSYKEASEVLDIPIGTLTSRLARGREALAALLDGPQRG